MLKILAWVVVAWAGNVLFSHCFNHKREKYTDGVNYAASAFVSSVYLVAVCYLAGLI
jgi:hypothetical protein